MNTGPQNSPKRQMLNVFAADWSVSIIFAKINFGYYSSRPSATISSTNSIPLNDSSAST
ncbi:hypothetical protein EV356DRAFT_501610 [Viridothelium virens]|uniref:Uncharacterized protein n=1 Tax=Viridothelium virens TaxID=1048519 RepID=A0A6A6HA33_VIRVR|nr:hypothetical protein EV356DRAFT_501610 [Viridothelium virens]